MDLSKYKFENPNELYYFPEHKKLPYRVYVPPKPGMKPGSGGLLDKLSLFYYQLCVTIGFYALNPTESAILQFILGTLMIFTLRYFVLCFFYFVKLLFSEA